MPLFFYRARNAMSKPEEGTIEALSLQHARDLLKTRGLFTEEIHEATMHDRTVKPMPSATQPIEPTKGPAVGPEPAEWESAERTKPTEPVIYFPLSDTLRLYFGWLLAWYGLIFAIGAYQHRGVLPFKSELIAGLAVSPIVLSTACGVFLFLMLSSLYKNLHGGVFKGLLLSVLGVVTEIWFVVNI